MMRVSALQLTLFIFLVSFCITIGCMENLSQQSSFITKPGDQGFKDITMGVNNTPVRFQDALNAIKTYQGEAPFNLSQGAVHLIRGIHLTPDGKAKQWIIGISDRNQKVFFTYNMEEQSVIPWRAWLPQQEILLSAIIAPDDLFHKHAAFLSKYNKATTAVMTIELVDDKYTLTIEDNKERKIVIFNAISGELIQDSE